MKRLVMILFLVPFTLFGRANAPLEIQDDQKLIVSNFETEDEASWENDVRILNDDDDLTEEPSIASPQAPKVSIDLKQVFNGSPYIYSLLLVLSMTAVFLWLYTILRWRVLSGYNENLKTKVFDLILADKRNEALLLCKNKGDLLSRMVTGSLSTERNSRKELEELMGHIVKKASSATWQRIGILNDIAMLAPMLGLMGTVLGMFYAFYDINRSLDSITKLFDGLGISVATTVAGLSVALLALLLHTFLKHRLIRRLTLIEQEAEALIPLLENKGRN